MAAEEERKDARFPAAVRVKLKYADVETFIQKYAANISRGGIFITSKSPPPIGTELKFEFLLASSEATTSIIRGEGRVKWVKDFDPQQPSKPHGMGVEFTRLDNESRQLVERALAWRSQKAKQSSPSQPALPEAPPPSAVKSEPPLAAKSEPAKLESKSRTAKPASLDVDALAEELGISEARIERALKEAHGSGSENELERLLDAGGVPIASKSEALANLDAILNRRR